MAVQDISGLSPKFSHIEIEKVASVFSTLSPYVFDTQQIYNGATRLKVTCVLPPMTKSQAGNWIAKLDELIKLEDTFFIDLSEYYVGYGITYFRLLSPTLIIQIDKNKHYHISFEGIEAI